MSLAVALRKASAAFATLSARRRSRPRANLLQQPPAVHDLATLGLG
jgi:hypothetical protein